jgi:hypothetical protein
MKSQLIKFLTFFFVFFFGIVNNPIVAQKGKTWPSCIDYKLKGNVKSWTMKNEDGIIRQQEFNKNGELTKDTYKGTVQTYIPPEYLPEKLKIDFEKIYTDKSEFKDSKTKIIFNERMQLTEKKTPNYYEINKFTKQGKIQVHKTTQIITQTRAWNSTHHTEPTYTFTDTVSFLVIYKYNQAGLLKEFEYYHSDPFKNIRMVYLYDAANNLIESNRFDNLNINLMSDNYLNKFLNKKTDSTFSINDFYNNYWDRGSPSKRIWRYNNLGQKIEFISQHFKATWEYDEKGQLIKEIHHDVSHNAIRCIIEFDMKGNVIKETDFDYWAKKEYNFSYEIFYY